MARWRWYAFKKPLSYIWKLCPPNKYWHCAIKTIYFFYKSKTPLPPNQSYTLAQIFCGSCLTSPSLLLLDEVPVLLENDESESWPTAGPARHIYMHKCIHNESKLNQQIFLQHHFHGRKDRFERNAHRLRNITLNVYT